MGDIANDIMDGSICQLCCDMMPDEEAPGYPRTCPECRGSGGSDDDTD